MRQRIAIDSLSDLILHIKTNLSEDARKQLKNMRSDELYGLHFSLGLHIRNTYELRDASAVPNLISEYLTWRREVDGDRFKIKDKDEKSIEIKEMVERKFYLDRDTMSSRIIRLLWRNLKEEGGDNS
ncbi:DUF6794 domain-containing protein [Paenibacillus thermotolerans]|uniref:DUF6794 domain-containing protein n=1 Tax=Paenibacillus thermotolerans TaxID=3027807 RepID=UPI002367C233|nr:MULTISPECIES: DUF6794 domain-containing protein [unclassified Paenibacillus]